MRRLFSTLAVVSATLTVPAVAQAQQDARTAIDDLVTCTLIYSRTSELYAEQGKSQQSQEFQSTTYAYGVVADEVASAAYGVDLAGEYVDQRMMRIMEALNAKSQSREGGDLDVIAEWLEYCDAMAPRVQKVLDQLDS